MSRRDETAKFFQFRLSACRADGEGGAEAFAQHVVHARIIYNMLKNRDGFPVFGDGAHSRGKDNFFFGHTEKLVSEFKNFTQFFPKFKFTLWLSYMFQERLYVLEVVGRTVLDEVIYDSDDGICITHDSRYFPTFTTENHSIPNEITGYFS